MNSQHPKTQNLRSGLPTHPQRNQDSRRKTEDLLVISKKLEDREVSLPKLESRTPGTMKRLELEVRVEEERENLRIGHQRANHPRLLLPTHPQRKQDSRRRRQDLLVISMKLEDREASLLKLEHRTPGTMRRPETTQT